MVDLSELEDPSAVWRAIEGDPSELVTLLRSDEKLGRWFRDELADWLEGKLQPVKLPQGWHLRRKKPLSLLLMVYRGHDITTGAGFAGWRYDRAREFIKKKGWHLKKAGRLYWSKEKLIAVVAARHKVDTETLRNYLERCRPEPSPRSSTDYVARRRLLR